MRVPSYRLHKPSGQAVVTVKGKDHYLGLYNSLESRAKYESIVTGSRRRAIKEQARKTRSEKDGPSYRLHARSGQAIVTIAGRDYYLGEYGSKESKAKYHRLKAEYIASGSSTNFGVQPSELTITGLLAAYVKHAKEYYGTGHESEFHRSTPVLSVLRTLYGTDLAIDFGPLQFEAVRVFLMQPIIKTTKDGRRSTRQRTRTYINTQMKRVRAVFRWATSKSMLPVSVLETLKTVEPLKFGRTTAPEARPILPVDDATVDETIKHLPPVVADMVRFQQLTGCRPGEVCKITPAMVDRSTDVWEVNLDKHKTAWRGKKRCIYVGPKAQAILRPYLLRAENNPCFSPAEAAKQRREAKHAARKTPLSCGNKPGSNIARKPKKAPGNAYTTQSYARAIVYACSKANIESWAPNRLRHSLATSVRKSDGLEAAAVILGHSEIGVTQVYAEADRAKAIEVVRRIG